MSRQQHTNEKFSNRITKNSNKINPVENDVAKLKKDYDAHILTHILDDLQSERFPGSGKPMHTYQDIADQHNTSASTVSRIANEHGLSRRGISQA